MRPSRRSSCPGGWACPSRSNKCVSRGGGGDVCHGARGDVAGGGGAGEDPLILSAHAAQPVCMAHMVLSHVPMCTSQVVLSHTPMRQLVPEFGDRPVLVSGRGRVLEVSDEAAVRPPP